MITGARAPSRASMQTDHDGDGPSGPMSLEQAYRQANHACMRAQHAGASSDVLEAALVDLQAALNTYMSIKRASLEVAATYINIANVYYHLKRDELALDMYQKALETYGIIAGELRGATIREPEEQHMEDVASCIANIGLVFETQGKYEEAMVHYTRALSIRERVNGDSEETARALADCADAYEKQARLIEDSNLRNMGAAYRRRALEMAARIDPPDPPSH